MQTDAVQAFVAICDLGSLQAAAQRLHLSQPAISKRLAALEARLDHRLFDRLGRGVTLTEAGRAYLPHARELLAVMADGSRALDSLGAQVSGSLRLTLSHHVGLHRMPATLKRYIQRYPQVQPEIQFMDSEAACHSVAIGESELAVITLPTPPMPDLIEHFIWQDPMSVYVAETHPLATQVQQTRQASIGAAALADFPAVLPPRESYTYAIIAGELARHGVRLAPRMTSHYLETLQMLAAIGLGWTVLPSSMHQPGLMRLAVDDLVLARRLGAVRDPRRSLSNAARALLAMLEAVDAASTAPD